ncbi:MAG: hypothetical protein AB1435_16940 [Chloroflexota bacterium]|jgi:hypothetical protein
MTENTTPKPEDMGGHLDEDIKKTVHDWAENPDESKFEDLDERVDEKLRRRVAGWVGVEEDADWKTIGTKMDANTREAIGGWVGAEPGADWAEISGKIENRIRHGIAKLVRAEPKPAPEAEPAEPGWSDIGAKIERDVRGWIGHLVGAEENANWKAVGDQVIDQVRTAFDKVAKSTKKKEGEEPYSPPARITIEGDEDQPPAVTSEEPIEPQQ